MVNVQVKRVPDELHMALKKRASDLGISLNDLLLEMLKRELSRPPIEQWIAEVRSLGIHKQIDVEKLMDDVRDERDER
ncbi:MAG: hypothetical protein H7288_05620 [Kineosporiaceae bacterium]|nr:hypothetical protein [Aeromicrobium sp.]